MIIDAHYHYFGLPYEKTPKDRIEHWLLMAERNGIKKSLEQVAPLYEDYMDDIECDKLVQRMDDSSVDITVINVVDSVDRGFDDEYILHLNKDCARAAAKHPGRVIALAGIDPRRPNAPELFRKCIEQFSMKGLKWHPDMGYYPNSKESYAVLEIVNKLGVPLLTHCGLLPRTRAKYSHPIHLDDIGIDFPNIPIIAAHMGDMLWRDWAAIAKYKKNIYGDLAMWDLIAECQPGLFRRYLREILDIVGPEQVLFASDGPVFEPYVSKKRCVEIVRSLTTQNSDGIKFSDEDVKAILGGNAARIFRL